MKKKNKHCTSLVLVCSAILGFVQNSSGQQTAGSDSPKKNLAEESQKLVLQVAESFEIHLEDEQNTELKLHPKPIFRFTNPVIGTLYSNVYVWTYNGRPEAVGSFNNWYSPNRRLGVEFQSLSLNKLTATRAGQKLWYPEKPGIELKPVPEAPVPSESAVGRLRQMRSFAREFSVIARAKNRGGEVHEKLRLLTRPIHRYQSTDPDLKDGALFTFVRGTDSVLLLLEARNTNTGYRWQYAFARLNSFDFQVLHKNREVWRVPQLAPPWSNIQIPTKPYIHFITVTSLSNEKLTPQTP